MNRALLCSVGRLLWCLRSREMITPPRDSVLRTSKIRQPFSRINPTTSNCTELIPFAPGLHLLLRLTCLQHLIGEVGRKEGQHAPTQLRPLKSNGGKAVQVFVQSFVSAPTLSPKRCQPPDVTRLYSDMRTCWNSWSIGLTG